MIDKLKAHVSSDTNFDKSLVELIIEDGSSTMNYVGYIHEENPEDLGELYIVFQENPPNPIYANQKGGFKLKEFLPFLQNLYDRELEARKQQSDFSR